MSPDISAARRALLVERYRAKLLRQRANVIARTETLRAVNAGQVEAWQQATLNPAFAGMLQKKWVVTKDDLLCPTCRTMLEMAPVPLREPFKRPLGPTPYPPLHPNCRCTLSLVRGTAKKPSRVTVTGALGPTALGSTWNSRTSTSAPPAAATEM